MRVFCLGDSNTYGYDPRSYFGGRYDETSRWVDVFAKRTGWEMFNGGENGRKIPKREGEMAGINLPTEMDMMIIMLGTNDLLQGASPQRAAERMEAFLGQLHINKKKIILISPPPMQPGAWVTDEALSNASSDLGKYYGALAQRLDIRFFDAAQWGVFCLLMGFIFQKQDIKPLQQDFLKLCQKIKSELFRLIY